MTIRELYVAIFFIFSLEQAFAQAGNFIKKTQDYLNGIQTLQANFEEQSQEGFRSGTFWWSRKEKKISLKYHPPTYLELYLNPYTLTIYEPLTKEINRYSIDSTPAGLLLKSYIDFKKDLKVTRTFCAENEFAVVVTQEEGMSLTLVFDLNPMMKLKGWIVKNIQGNEIQILLNNVQIGIAIDKKILLPPA